MKAYVICIVVATLLNLLAEKMLSTKSKKIGIIILAVSLFFVCLIAGVRTEDTGTDIKVYVTRLINVYNSTGSFFSYIKKCNSDIGFAGVVYIGCKANDINVVLFLIEFAVALPIYIYAYLERKEKSPSLNILIFLLTMYCISLNQMRQSIAIAWCILSYHYFENKQTNKLIVTILVAISFHKTAVIFTIAFLISYLIGKKIKRKGTLIFICIIIMIILSAFMDKLIVLTSYSGYLERESSLRVFSIGSILKRLFWIGLGVFSLNYTFKDTKKHNNILTGVIFALISLILNIISFKIPGTGRLGYYFNNISYFLLINDIPKCFKQKNEVKWILIIILFALWWNMTVSDRISGVYPYESNIITLFNE